MTESPGRASQPALISRAFREPHVAASVFAAVLRGHWYRFKYRVLGVRFTAGRGLRVFGRLDVRGKGEVVLGERVSLSGRVTPWTEGAGARISIGDDSALDGVRFGCQREITIGRRCLLAECRILDTDFHSTRVDRRVNAGAPVRVAAVRIEDNVWVGLEVGILPGTVIGENSVVSFGAVCAREYPANSVIMGNPARVVSTVPGLEIPGTIPPSRVGVYTPPVPAGDPLA